MIAIKTVGLTKKYKDVVAVDRLDLEIEQGKLFALLGVNGAGKTTTVKMLSSLVKPTSGECYIMGRSLSREESEIKNIIDLSMQETAIARNLTVEENVDFYANLNGIEGEQKKSIKEYIGGVFGLDKVLKRRASKLSGGWQRKLSIALSLIKSPEVLFLDEPTLGLDVISRRELWKAIKELKGKMTVLLTTHYMEEAEELADEIGIMKDGKLLFCGTKEELFDKTGKNSVENAFIQIVEGEENL
ncbi:MAG: ABC transporter ATP-binding protein [Clostridia bacterium]|nr:ABC transporter ATP-binding protein [Clostridia bacterium]